jgi:hypothetical protein
MTFDDYVEYYTSMILIQKLTVEAVEAKTIAEAAVRQGLDAFWGANDWYFKENQTTLAVTETADDYTIADFESFRTVREQASISGRRLKFYAKEEFDKLVPNPSTFASGNPQAFTAYRDIGDRKWKVAFFPRPDAAMTIYLSVYIEPQSDPKLAISLIPTRFMSGLEAFIGYKIYPPGDRRRQNAYVEAMNELKRLQVENKLDMSSPNFMPDGTDEQVTVERPWI